MFSLTPRLLIVAGVLLALSTAHGLYQSHRAKVYSLQVVAAKQRATELQGALAAANYTVDRLNAGNKKLIEVATLQKQMLRESVAQLDRTTKELQKWKTGVQVKEDRDNALPNCQKVLAIDLGGVCPGHADGMRDRSNRLPG